MEYKDYQLILEHDFPKIPDKSPTLLEIAGMPHYENVDSNIWAFFLNPHAEHGLEDLFLQSLIALCLRKYKEKGIHKELNIINPTIHRELSTNTTKRMDIVLDDENSVIIVENKIFHWLANDLGEYWEHFDESNYPSHRKAGVVLALHPTNGIDNRFVSITHQELNTEILSGIGRFLLQANPKYLSFLYDFIANKQNFYMPDQTQESFTFLFEHREKINRLIDIKNSLVTSVLKQVDQGSGTFVMARKTQIDYRYYTFEETPNLYYTILIRHILDEDPHYSIILEGNHIDQEVFDQIRMLAKELTEGLDHIQVIDSKPNHAWFHLLTIRKQFNIELLETMGSEITSIITSPAVENVRKKIVERFLELTEGAKL